MLSQCCADVVDGGPTLVQHLVDVSCLLGSSIDLSRFRSTHKVKWRGVFHEVNISYQQIETTQLFEGMTVHCMSGNRE